MALPVIFYRDPADGFDRLRKMREAERHKAERNRANKARRIQLLTKLAMKGVLR